MAERRRSQRIAQDITIQLVGMQPDALSAAAQQARTIDVSEQGAMIECRSKFEPGAEVMIHNPKNSKTGLFKVIRTKPSPGGFGWNLALELQDIIETDFWGLR